MRAAILLFLIALYHYNPCLLVITSTMSPIQCLTGLVLMVRTGILLRILMQETLYVSVTLCLHSQKRRISTQVFCTGLGEKQVFSKQGISFYLKVVFLD